MFERWLDIGHQHRRRLIVALVIVPCLLAAGSFFADRSQTVTARVWIGAPIALMVPGTSSRPADVGAAALRQWLKGDAFVDQVLTALATAFDAQPYDRQSALRRDLRHNLTVAADGDQVMVLSYRTDEPAAGASVLAAAIATFESRAVTAIIDQVSAPNPAASLQRAGTVVQYAFEHMGSRPVPPGAADLRRYFAGLTFQRMSNAQLDTFRAAILDRGVLTPARMSLLEQAIFETVDAPAAGGRMSSLNWSVIGLGLVAVALIGLVIVTRLAFREERIRSGADVQQRTAIPYVGSMRGGEALAVIERCRPLFRSLRLPDQGATIAVTSPGRGEGRSTIAAGLALAIARETEQRVLLLDLDFAHPGQERGPLRRACDPQAQTPVEVESKERFRWTVVDLPPALPLAAGWVEVADASILVGRYRSTTIDALSTTAALLPARPAGFLMTADRGLPEWVRRFL